MEGNQNEELQRYINIFLKHKYTIISILGIFFLIGAILYIFTVPSYTSQAGLSMGTSSTIEKIGRETIGYDINFRPTSAQLISWGGNNEVISNVIDEFNLTGFPLKRDLITRLKTFDLNPVEYLTKNQLISYYKGQIIITAKSNTITIRVTSQYPQISAELANQASDAIIIKSKEEKQNKIKRTLDFLEIQINATQLILNEKQAELRVLREAGSELSKIYYYQSLIKSEYNLLSPLKKEYEELKLKDVSSVRDSLEEIKLNIQLESVNLSINETQTKITAYREKLLKMDLTLIETSNELRFEVQNNQETLYNLLADKQAITLTNLMDPEDVTIISKAAVPFSPNKGKSISQLFSLFMLGIIVTVGIVFLLEMRGKKFFESLEDVEKSLDEKVLGSIPAISKENAFKLLDPKQESELSIIEAYRTLATNIKFSTKGKKIKSIMFTSDKPETGKSMTVCNLGLIMASPKTKILIVDVDLRRPTIHNHFNLTRKPGFTDVLSGNASLKEAKVKINSYLDVIPAGKLSYNPESVLESEQMKTFIKEVASKYDFVLCDSIPLTTFSDVDILASVVDASILILDEETSDRKGMKFSKKRLSEVNSHILGIIVNKAEKRFSPYFRSYYYYKKYRNPTKDMEEWEAELIKFVIDAISKGATEEEIKNELIDKCWPAHIVERKVKEGIKLARQN